MPPDDRDDLRRRVERLEQEVERLRQRLEPRAPRRVEPGPPPVIFERPSREPSWPTVERVAPKTAAPPPPKAPASTDTEFKFGSQVLPRAGIVLVLLGILYLVAYAIQTGRITLAWQFAGEIALCAVLIGLGVWKLNEKEDFGQVLVGGGSCGLYFSFAGAHVYKDILTGEALVALYLLLSLANLAFSWWRSSRTFWGIGFVGGLIGAALPLDEHNFTATFVLAGVIVAAATVLAAGRTWLRAIEVLWFVVALYVLFIGLDAVEQGVLSVPVALAVFYGFSLVPLAAHALRFEPSDFDPSGWFEATAGGLTGIATLAFGKPIEPAPHSVSVIVLSLALGALAFGARRRANFGSLVATSIAVASVIAPMAFKAYVAGITYAALSVLFSLPAHLKGKALERPSALFSAAFVALTVLAYAIALTGPRFSNAQELTLLAAIALSVSNLALVAGRLEDKMEVAVTAGAAVLYPVLLRAAFIGAPGWGSYALIFPSALYAIAVSVISIRARWTGPAYVALLITAIGTVLYWSGPTGAVPAVSPWREIAALGLTTVGLVLAAAGAGRSQEERPAMAILASCLGAFIVVPMFMAAFALPGEGMERQASTVAAMATYALALSLVSWRSKWPGYAIIGMIVAGLAVVVFADATASTFVSRTDQIPLVAFVGVALAAAASFSGKDEQTRLASWTVASVVGCYVLSRLFFLVLTLPAIGMDQTVATYLSIALYSLVPASLSLWKKWLPLAYVGGAAILLTVGVFWLKLLDALTSEFPRGDEIAFLLVASVAATVCTIAAGKGPEDRKNMAIVGAFVGLGTLARALQLALESAGIATQASITLSWSLYAGLLLALGFVYDARQLRISSLVLFGITLVKVFLVDLAALDAFVRVFLLIALGALLILFGYVYVRRRGRQQSGSGSPGT